VPRQGTELLSEGVDAMTYTPQLLSACFFGALTMLLAFLGPPTCRGAEEDTRPQLDANPDLWKEKWVMQRRGWVLDAHDASNLITNGFWLLSHSAIGHVVQVDAPARTCIVKFDNRDGWQRIELQTKRREKTRMNVDSYGNMFMERWVEEGLAVDPGDHGKIISEDTDILVRFPLSVIGLKPPRKGDVVMRGPDWSPRSRVDGCRGREQERPCTGIVLDDLDHEFYVRVQWRISGLIESHRFDCRRYYDVMICVP
jgi:hypothetical protein